MLRRTLEIIVISPIFASSGWPYLRRYQPRCGQCNSMRSAKGLYQFFKGNFPSERKFYDLIPALLEKKYLSGYGSAPTPRKSNPPDKPVGFRIGILTHRMNPSTALRTGRQAFGYGGLHIGLPYLTGFRRNNNEC